MSKRISELTKVTVLDGTELIPLVKGGINVSVDSNNMVAGKLIGEAKTQVDNIKFKSLLTRQTGVIASGTDGVRIAGGWGAPVSNIATETVDVRRPGSSVVRLTLPAGAGTEVAARIKVYPRVLTGKFEFWVKMPKVSAGSVYLGIVYSSDTPAADPPTGRPASYRRIVLTTGMFNPGVWTCLTIDQQGKVYAQPGTSNGITWQTDTGTPDPAEIEFLEVTFGCDASVPTAERTMLIDQVGINGKAKPMVMFGFDGFNLTSHQTIVKPLFDKLGIRGYIAGDGDAITPVRSFLQDRYSQGWDIVSSGMGHRNYALAPEFLSSEYDQCRALLDAEGFTRASKFFVYPNTARTDVTDAILASKGVIMSRTPGGPANVISNLGTTSLMRINTFDWGLQAIETIRGWSETAFACGELLSPLNHTVKTGMTATTDTERATFETIVKETVAKQDAGLLDIVTPTELAERLGVSLSH